MSPRVKAGRTEYAESRADLRYDQDGRHSFFRDLALKAESDDRRRAAMDDPVLRGRDQGDAFRLPSIMEPKDIELIEKRLHAAAYEPARRRAMGVHQQFDLAAGTATALIPTAQLPAELAGRFEIAARSRATVAQALGTSPIPEDTGMTVAVARLESGASVSVQASENSGVSETDPAFGLPANAIAYASGIVDVSRQLLDRAGDGTAGRLDTVISAELGRAAGTVLDQQILNGAAASGETRGLLNTANITSTTYTSGTPTVAGYVSKLGSNYADIATNYGVRPDTLFLHPRRTAWLASQTIGSGENQPDRIYSLYDRVIEAPCMPTTISTNQDPALSVRTDACHVFADSTITAHSDPGSGNLTVRFRVLVRVAVVVPLGAAVGKLLGTGTAAPTFA